jgi:hypothetical protein
MSYVVISIVLIYTVSCVTAPPQGKPTKQLSLTGKDAIEQPPTQPPRGYSRPKNIPEQLTPYVRKCEDKNAKDCEKVAKYYFRNRDVTTGAVFLKQACKFAPKECETIPYKQHASDLKKKCNKGNKKACKKMKKYESINSFPQGYSEDLKPVTLNLSSPEESYKTCVEAIRLFDIDGISRCFSNRNLNRLTRGYIKLWHMSFMSCGGFERKISEVTKQHKNYKHRPIDPNKAYIDLFKSIAIFS